jgi:hypothetical protein
VRFLAWSFAPSVFVDLKGAKLHVFLICGGKSFIQTAIFGGCMANKR